MPTRHLLDPELAVIAQQPSGLPLNDETLSDLRAAFAVTEALSMEAPFPGGVRKEHWAQAPDGRRVRLMVFRREQGAALRPALLHIHPGGMIVGKPELSAASNQRIVTGFDCVIVSVDYRLAPENPHPAQLDDCALALDWLIANAAELGVDVTRIGVIGESAGGGLAAGLVLRVRDAGGPALKALVLLYPMLDDRTVLTERHPYVGQYVWQPEKNLYGWSAFLGHAPGEREADHYAAPSRAESFEGLPPTYVAVGSMDLFLEENLEFARRLIRDGVPTELHVYPGAPHGFDRVEAGVTHAMRRDRQAAIVRLLG